MARPRKRQSADEEVEIDLDGPEEREEQIRRASGRLQDNARILKIKEYGRTQVIEGARPALDILSLLPRRSP